MNFIPDTQGESKKVPYYEDARVSDGWQGHTTDKSMKILQSEVTQAVVRLGGMVTNFQRGAFQTEQGKRDGYRVHYFIEAPNGQHIMGRIDVAALPINPRLSGRADKEKHRERSLKMALFMLRNALDGAWFLQQLSPGYAALMPFMLDNRSQKTISEMWSESPVMSRLLPPPSDEFVEGEIVS